MHIVFLVHYFPIKGKATGGAANYVANIARIMSDKGHVVEVITEDEYEETFEWEGVIVHKIKATRGFHNNGRPMPVYKKILKNICRSYWYNKEVAGIDKKKGIDIVQSVNTYGLALLRKNTIPYIVRLSDYPALWSGANREEFDFNRCVASRRIDEEIQFIALKRADSLIAPSFLVQRLIDGRLGVKPKIIESPVLIEDNSSTQLTEEFDENQYFLTFSEMNYRKEIHIVARIIDELLEEYPAMKYVVCGKDREIFWNGRYMPVSEMFRLNVIKNTDRFVFMGEISDRSRLFSIVKCATICVLPTRVDNLPNTCLEAMTLGKIVVSSTSEQGTSVEQLITDGYNGFLAEVDNAEGLYQKIKYIMQLPDNEKREIERRAKDRVKDLTADGVYKEMIQIYEKTIECFGRRK